METNLLDRMLSSYLQEGATVTVTLQNKVRITGKIVTFDSYVLVLDGQRREFVYRHAVASVAAGTSEVAPRQTAPQKTAAKTVRTKSSSQGRQKAEPSVRTSTGDPALNTGMKDGLLKWMQEQKAAK